MAEVEKPIDTATQSVTSKTNGKNGFSNHDDESRPEEVPKRSEDDVASPEKMNGSSSPKKVLNGASSDKVDDDDSSNGHKTEPPSVTVTDDDSMQDSIQPANKRPSPRKAAEVSRAGLTEYSSSSDDDFDDDEVEEIHDDDELSDSVMEVDPEDPLSITEKPKPNIVTIDDVRTLKHLANSTKKSTESNEKPSVVVIDTKSILAGKTSGVTITPAKPKVLPVGGTTIGSGVTISQASTKPASKVSLPAGITMTSVGQSSGSSSFSSDKQGQLNDPNLTDDMFVVEAPSFIVPYVYEKPPKESFTEFKKDLKRLTEEAEKKKKEGKDGSDEEEVDSDQVSDEEDKKTKAEDKENKEKSGELEETLMGEATKKPATFFESTLGKFLINLGMNLVQEHVQTDLLREQTRKSHKDKSASVMHAVMSLKKNLEASKEKNEAFHYELLKCRQCSFRTESKLALENHLEMPHLKHGFYRCNFCHFETKIGGDILSHMQGIHGVRARLERPIPSHQCPQCPFEDNMRGKLTRHKVGCDKRFRPDRNQEAPHDWEPPAKIPKPMQLSRVGRPNFFTGPGANANIHSMTGGIGLGGLAAARFQGSGGFGNNLQSRNSFQGLPQLQFGPRGRGRTVGPFRSGQSGFRHGSTGSLARGSSAMLNSQVSLHRPGTASALLNTLGSNSSVTIQSISQRNSSPKTGQPSISITPLPGRGGQGGARASVSPQVSSQMKPGQPGGHGKSGFVICEICDGYIKDLEQLRNHMQWIHKVKIHPRMIYNRPPLNCQKCQFRFFTDQGLERHLLGSHGLVTASMQELANKGQDSGRCPVCGKVYQWKLLNHVSKDHQKTLKPAHLSYKCTVCTATFGQYKLFENHVYTAHSSGNKKAVAGGQPPSAASSAASKSAQAASEASSKSESSSQKKEIVESKVPPVKKKVTSESDADVIELDDEDIDAEERPPIKRLSPGTAGSSSPTKKLKPDEDDIDDSDGDEVGEGVEEIEDDED